MKSQTTNGSNDAVKRVDKSLARRFPAIAMELRRQRIAYVRYFYNGMWDRECFQDAQFHDEQTIIASGRLTVDQRAALRIHMKELLEVRFPGWANAEGSRGEFEWDVVRDELTHVHCLRLFEYEHTTIKGP